MNKYDFSKPLDVAQYMLDTINGYVSDYNRNRNKKYQQLVKDYDNLPTGFFSSKKGDRPSSPLKENFGFYCNIKTGQQGGVVVQREDRFKEKSFGWIFSFYDFLGAHKITGTQVDFKRMQGAKIKGFINAFEHTTGHVAKLDGDYNIHLYFNRKEVKKENGFCSEIAFKKSDLEKGKLVYGFDDLGQKITVDIDKMTHILIAGISGSGKSVFQNYLLQSVFYNLDMFKVVVLADLKGGVEFFPYDNKHEKLKVCSNISELREVITRSVVMMQKRLEQMRAKGIKKWDGDFHLLMIDEYAVIQMHREIDKDAKAIHYKLLSDLNLLSAQGRAAGIRLIVGLQKTTTDQMDSAFKNNLQTQVSFKLKSALDISNVFGSSDDIKEMNISIQKMSPGQCIIYDDTKGEFMKCTVPNLKDSESVFVVS